MVATLSNIHKLILFSSQNLKSWKFMSTFGPYNAVNGAWECPDLFPLRVGGVGPEKWVILIGTNPGANYAGSGTQYFVGTFDGTTFTADQDSVSFDRAGSRSSDLSGLLEWAELRGSWLEYKRGLYGREPGCRNNPWSRNDAYS